MPKQSNQEKAINALINTNSITDAAKACGLSEATIYRYLNDENFQREYRKARRSLVESSIGQMQKATAEAVETLRKNLHCEIPSVEVRSAQIILDSSIKGIELIDILERLENLEYEHQKQNQNT